MMVLLIALFALPAQADFWATGNDKYAAATGATAWGDNPNPYKLTVVDNTHFTLTMNVSQENYNQPIILRIAASDSNDWDTFNGNSWGVTAGQTNAINETGSDIKKCSTNNTNLQFTPTSAGTYILDISNVNLTNNTAFAKIIKQSSSSDLPENLYIGLNITSSDWTFGTPMESKGNGVFEYTFTNDNKNPFYFLISAASTNTPKWTDTEKANFYGPESGDYLITTANGRMNAAQKVTKGKGNVFKMTEDGTYKVTVNLTDATNGTVTVSPVQSSSASYRLKTSADNWKKTIDLTDDDNDGIYSCTMTDPAEGLQFMVQKDGSDFLWPTSAVTYSGGEQTINLGNTSGNNITMGGGLSGKYTITLDPDAKTLTITGTAVASNDLAIGFGEYTYASSDNLWNGSEQKYNTYTITGKGGAKFRIYDSNGKSYGPSIDTDIENGKTYSDIGENTNYFVVPNDGRDYVVAINSFDGSKVSFSVTRAAVVGKELAIAGSAVGTGYNYDSGHKIWNSETETYDSYIIDTQSQSGDTYVKFYSTSNPYGPSEGDGKELEVGTLTGKILDNGSWKVAKGKKFKVTVLEFDPTNETTPLTIKVEEVKPKVALVTDQIATSNLEWTYENGIKLAAGEQTSVSLTNKELNFRFVDENGTYYYPANNDVTVNDGEYQTNATKTSLDKCYKIAAREGEVIVSVVEFSQGSYVKFAINGIANLYFKANLNSWTMNATTKMTRVDANTFVYRVDNVDVSTLTTDNLGNVLEFGFIADKNGNGTQDDGEWYWAANNENSFKAAGSYERTLYQGGTDKANFWSSVSGNYVFTVTVNNSGVPQKVVINIDGGEASHKPYYFVGDMNDWFSKEFTDPNAPQGMDKDVMNANKKDWEFTFIDEIPGKTELGKGWYKIDIECLTGQFQIFDGTDAMWNGDVYSHDPYVRGYGNNGGKDHNSFKAYINRPISKTMISESQVITTTTNKATATTEAKPAIRRSQGSNFHLGCNAVRNAKIYFLPGNDPKLIVSGTPEDYYIFYSEANKAQNADGKVTAQIVNGKPNTNNYYLPGVKYDNVALPNYINEDGTTDAHMNMQGVDLVKFDFSAENIDTTFNSDAFRSMFNTASVGGMTLDDFKNNLKNNQKLPNGISLERRTTVYVQKIPNGFEYPAGRKYALQFINACPSDKNVLTPVAASNLYFFNDAVHVNFNIDNYEDGAKEKNRFVKMYYRIYTYDEKYNTVVINTDDGTKKQIHSKGEEIGLTAGSSTKDLGWVALNEKKAPSAWGGTVADTGYSDLAAWNVAWVSGNPGNRKHIDSKYGNCYVQFKVETGPNPSNASAANRANAEESDRGTLYIPERALIRNTPEFYTFNGKDLYVALDGGYTTTDVEDVFEDQIVEEGVDAEPIFFNLQGQRVVNPEKGMYIVVKGNKTYKVMIK